MRPFFPLLMHSAEWNKDPTVFFHNIVPTSPVFITHKIMQKRLFFTSWCICECNLTVWILKTILRINGNTFSGAHCTSFRRSVMRKCEEQQLTFKSGAFLIGNGRGAAALCDLARCKYLTRSSVKWMSVKKVVESERKYTFQHFVFEKEISENI